MKKITIAIDGYSSCGKSTLAKALSQHLDYLFIDTGAMYRAVAYFCNSRNWISISHIDNESIINGLSEINLGFKKNEYSSHLEIHLNGINIEGKIRSLEISSLVSKIASIKEVRDKLVIEQQKIGKNGGVVMDGRDIGTVVFPMAELKLFVTADPEIRTERRYKELIVSNPSISREAIKKNLEERDFLDTTRTESPLKKASDAILLDNSFLNQEEQLLIALRFVNEILI